MSSHFTLLIHATIYSMSLKNNIIITTNSIHLKRKLSIHKRVLHWLMIDIYIYLNHSQLIMRGKIRKITIGSTSIKFWSPLVVVLVGSRPFSSLVASGCSSKMALFLHSFQCILYPLALWLKTKTSSSTKIHNWVAMDLPQFRAMVYCS